MPSKKVKAQVVVSSSNDDLVIVKASRVPRPLNNKRGNSKRSRIWSLPSPMAMASAVASFALISLLLLLSTLDSFHIGSPQASTSTETINTNESFVEFVGTPSPQLTLDKASVARIKAQNAASGGSESLQINMRVPAGNGDGPFLDSSNGHMKIDYVQF